MVALYERIKMYLTPTENHWACDIEADGLLDEATRIHCACVENVLSGEKKSFVDADSFASWMAGQPPIVFIGHNFLAYDLVMLNRHWKTDIPVSRIVDTFILSQIYNPAFPRPQGITKKKSGHSLEAWGIRLKFPKTEYSDFSKFTPEMLEYCTNDTSLTALLFRKLASRMTSVGFTEDGCEIEHLAWHIIQNKQRRNGFPFDRKKAEALYVELAAREEELRGEIFKLWPPVLKVVQTFRNAYKRDGTHTANYARHKEQFVSIVCNPDGTYDAYDYVSFNLGSSDQRVSKLLSLGWTPSKFTKKTDKGGGGNPQVDEDELLAFAEASGVSELKALAKWLVVSSRMKMINTWINAINPKTGNIHGRLFIASTLRYRHSDPNSSNVPAVRTAKRDGKDVILLGEEGAWAYECRDLFYTGETPGWTLVGIDATGIQNRCLIHHLIETVGEEAVAPFRDLSLKGDIHKHNISVLGLVNKAASKKFFYTLMMGGGGERLAADQAQFGTKMTPKEGALKKKALIGSMPGFNDLIKKLQTELSQSGRIELCDGTPILVPSPHMVVPYILQGDESRLMKKALILVDREIRKNKLSDHVFKVLDSHDEWQFRVRNEYVKEFIRMALPCFPQAGKYFGYRISIDADAKEGQTWAETH